jgi:hypothetical protein
MPSILLRYDDYSALGATELERRLFETVAACDAKMVVSIIPFIADVVWNPRGPIRLRPLPPEKADILRRFNPQHLAVALHGYCHQAISRTSGMTEFGDRIPREQQLARLLDGKAYLEDLLNVELKTFVPPWNEYGASTIAALEESGFCNLSGDAAFGPLTAGLTYIPATCSLAELPRALRLAAKDSASLVCVLIHEYDFKESGSSKAVFDMTQFEGILRTAKAEGAQWVGFNECAQAGDWGAERARANQELRQAMKSPFRRLLPRATGCVYWSTRLARRYAKVLEFCGRLWR